ncbi:Receptor-like protein [Thalictrum thalictroides]|uniref:Receptor-like protein n=1 Tax=Thalictrum thalictroides TaxID=46969 RepID=A0A7J6V6R3_THATH|nr:Receptor-like protein [Thalictrum thalictroides]
MLPNHHLLLLCLFSFIFSSSSRPEPFALRISCGSRTNIQTPPTKTIWFKDFAYTGGRPANASPSSYITPPLKTLRYFPLSDGSENCYNIHRVPKGHYLVRIFFGLVKDPNFDNEPLFDVSVEGTLIYSLDSGWSQIEDQSFTEALVFVTDGSVSACFHSTGHGDPAILSIEILQIDDKGYYFGKNWGEGVILRTEKRLSCGSGKPAFDEDYNGDHWGGDRFWSEIKTFGETSDNAISTENKISKASVSPNFYPEKLYRTALVSTDSEPDLEYTIEVDPNRNYSIWLHFAEIDSRITGEGQRVFDILINGDIAFKDIDVMQMSGDRYAALVLNKTIAVNGRSLAITLHPTTGHHAIINAIEIFEIIPAESRTAAQEVRALETLKNSLGLPLRFGWNGDPCVPQQHPWSGVDCQLDKKGGTWVIDGL